MPKETVNIIQIEGVHYWVEKFPHRKQWALVRYGPEKCMAYVVAYFKKEEEALQFRQHLEDISNLAMR